MELKELNKGQMKIQQMAFMIIAVFLFFILVGLFFVKLQLGGIQDDLLILEREQAISSLEIIANMPELVCDSNEPFCLDKDKLRVMSGEFGELYQDFWPVASVKVYEVYPAFEEVIKCPEFECNYYEIYDNGQQNLQEFSTFVSICEEVRENFLKYDRCNIGKLVVGMKIRNG